MRQRLRVAWRAARRSWRSWKRFGYCSINSLLHSPFNLCFRRPAHAWKRKQHDLHFKQARQFSCVFDNDVQSSVAWDQKRVTTGAACHPSSRFIYTGFPYQTTCTHCFRYWWESTRRSESSGLNDWVSKTGASAYIFFFVHIMKGNLLDPTLIETVQPARIFSVQNFLLLQAVIRHNIHTPCNHLNLCAVCKIDDMYSKHFPKDYIDKTGHDESQLYVVYRRGSPSLVVKPLQWFTASQKVLQL